MSAPNNGVQVPRNGVAQPFPLVAIDAATRSGSASALAHVGGNVKQSFRPAKASASVSGATAGMQAAAYGASAGVGMAAGAHPQHSTWQSYSPAVSAAPSPAPSATTSPAGSKPGSPRERFEATLEAQKFGDGSLSPTTIRRSTSSDFLTLDAPAAGSRPKLASSPRSIHPSGAHTARGLSHQLAAANLDNDYGISSAESTPPGTIARPSPPTSQPPPIANNAPSDAISLPGTPPSSLPKIPPPSAMKFSSAPGTPRSSVVIAIGTPLSSPRTGSFQAPINSARSSPAPSTPTPASTATPPPAPPPPPPPPTGWRPSSPHSLSNSAAASGDVKAMLKDLKKKEKEDKKKEKEAKEAKKKEEKEEKKKEKEEKKKHKTIKSSHSATSLTQLAAIESGKRTTRESSPTPSAPGSPSRSNSNATPPNSLGNAVVPPHTPTSSYATSTSAYTSSNATSPATSHGSGSTAPPFAVGTMPQPDFNIQAPSSPSELLRKIADSEEHGAHPLTPGQIAVRDALQPDPIPAHMNRHHAHLALRTPPGSPAPEPPKKISLADFRVIKLIGKGGFGEVYLVEHNEKKKKMALKVLDKHDVENEAKMQQILNERAVLVRSFKSPFLLSLSYCFQDDRHLYFAMKYCPGGDLRALLSAIGAFEEEEARLYMAEMILSVNALHRLGYIHRDLKPDNFLIDDRGHLVLADFGLSKEMYSLRKSASTKVPLARERSLSTIAPQPVAPGHNKSPSLLLGPQNLVGLNASNVDSRFIRRRGGRREGNMTDMTGSFNPMMGFTYNPANPENEGGFSYDSGPSFGSSSYVPPSSSYNASRMSSIFDNDNPMSGSYNPMTATFSVASVRPVIQYSDLPPKAQTRRMMAFSVVGSPDYMSPEVLSEHGYGEEVDWWSVGCLFFELVLGIPPFTGQSIQEVFDNIANWETRLPQILEQYKSYLSPPCYDLLCGLLCDSSKRLGKNGISELQNHPFFEGLDWTRLEEEEPPFVPRLENEEDTSYFEANVANKQQVFIPTSALSSPAISTPSSPISTTRAAQSAANLQSPPLAAPTAVHGQPPFASSTPPPNDYYKQFSYSEAELTSLMRGKTSATPTMTPRT